MRRVRRQRDKSMKNVFFKPWIGKDYRSGGIFGKKILVLGEAHLCGADCKECGVVEKAEECADFTTKAVSDYLGGCTLPWTNTYRKFERSLVNHETDLDESRTIWHSVAFYNYLQRAMDKPRHQTGDATDHEAAEAAFFETLDELHPDLVIVWGKRLYWLLPEGNRWREDEPLVIDEYEVPTGYYRLSDGTETRVLWVYHPSTGYSWDWWHKVIRTEL